MSNRFINISLQSALLLMGTSIVSNSFANDSAVQLLNKMHTSLHKLQYQGNLVYMKDGQVSNLSVDHSVVNGKEIEIVKGIDSPSHASGSASKKINNFSLGRIPKVTPALQKIYSFDLGAKSKVAGRSCQIVLARPKDRKRYLQKYCIDAKHSIVLKYTLIDQKHKTVEQFMFTSFKVLSANKKSQNIMAQISKSLIPVKAMTKGRKSNKEASWIFDSLPTGFKPISNHWVKNDKFNRKSKQLIVSDGMTSVSVFISKGTSKNGEPISSGALNIVSHKLLAYEVVLVGEVPKATLEDIFKALRKL